MKNIAIVIGHTQSSKGACSNFGIPCEWDYNMKVADYLKDIADVYVYNSYALGYTTMVKRMAEDLNKGNYKLVIELHYNAASFEANGCEALYYFSNKEGKKYADYFTSGICASMGVKNRGTKALLSPSNRGYAAVYYPKATTILLEPFFGSNESDTLKFKGNEKKYADTLRQLISKM